MPSGTSEGDRDTNRETEGDRGRDRETEQTQRQIATPAFSC